MTYIIAFIIIMVARFGFGVTSTTGTFISAFVGFSLGGIVDYLLNKDEKK